VTQKIPGFFLRTAPSAGALYPVENYLVVNRVEGIEPGIYHWNLWSRKLELVKAGDWFARVAGGRAQPGHGQPGRGGLCLERDFWKEHL